MRKFIITNVVILMRMNNLSEVSHGASWSTSSAFKGVRNRDNPQFTDVNRPAANETMRRSTKHLMLRLPMQLFTAWQWWSKPLTQTPHVPQWEAIGGLEYIQVLQLRMP